MAIRIEQLDVLLEDLEMAKTQKARLEGESEALLGQLRKDYGCDSVESAQKKIQKLEKNIKKLEEELEQDLQKLEQNYEF